MIGGKNGDIPIVIVAGMGKSNRVIGDNNKLLWHVPEDLKRFKKLTLGHPVIMGRKTFESIIDILGKPLPGRTNIVVTHNENYQFDDVKIATSLDEAFALATAENPSEIHIGGGAELYKLTLPLVDRLHLTFFNDTREGDTFFPDFTNDFEVETEHPPMTYEGLEYQWVDFVRKST